ncbi:MAG: DUF2950 domain-containing protein, partial [Anaerolineales bacterium]|nr:DUF2950 domain-containing protein [Anaerolineales bacterium]
MTSRRFFLVLAGALGVALLATSAMAAAPAKPAQRTFPSAKAAADALVSAAEKFDVEALKAILGPDGEDLVVTEDAVAERNQAAAFAAKAREKLAVELDPKDPQTATLVIGADQWPVPIPVVEVGGTWRFDSKAAREEVLYRRVGRNELDAIALCREYVRAQHEYAMERHDGSRVNQYAQRVISTPGKHDGLAWQATDGTWQGPLGETAARAIMDGYTDRSQPYRGYYFKILKGQGPHAQLG